MGDGLVLLILNDGEVVVLLHVFYPFARLPLRIDHQGPPPRVRHNYSVVHGEGVLREATYLPLPKASK